MNTNLLNRPTNTTNPKMDDATRKKVTLIVAGSVMLFIVGLLIGMGVGHTHTVTKTVAVNHTQTITKTVNVPTVPDQCLIALDEADKGFTIAARLGGTFGDFVTAVANQDTAGIQKATTDVKGINNDLSSVSPAYNVNKAACRNASH